MISVTRAAIDFCLAHDPTSLIGGIMIAEAEPAATTPTQ
jgi:hypothetical protein